MDDKKSLLAQRPDYLVCTCMGVMFSEIVEAIENGATDFQALQDELLVGTGCNSCIPEIEQILSDMIRTPGK